MCNGKSYTQKINALSRYTSHISPHDSSFDFAASCPSDSSLCSACAHWQRQNVLFSFHFSFFELKKERMNPIGDQPANCRAQLSSREDTPGENLISLSTKQTNGAHGSPVSQFHNYPPSKHRPDRLDSTRRSNNRIPLQTEEDCELFESFRSRRKPPRPAI